MICDFAHFCDFDRYTGPISLEADTYVFDTAAFAEKREHKTHIGTLIVAEPFSRVCSSDAAFLAAATRCVLQMSKQQTREGAGTCG